MERNNFTEGNGKITCSDGYYEGEIKNEKFNENENIIVLMVIIMMVIGFMIHFLKELVVLFMIMGIMKENFIITKNIEKENIILIMEIILKVNINLIK